MAKKEGAQIQSIEPGSIAARLGLQPGDTLFRVNGLQMVDLIDYLLLCAEERIELEIINKSGEKYQAVVQKESHEPLGMVFEEIVFDGIKACSNHCLFCFVHQLPAKQRASLYIMDDDYRLSFLQGNYVTLTNLAEPDWQRIEQLHLSPLYISVHATDPEIRRKLLGESGREVNVVEQLKRLAEARITVHTQVVLCAGINDGPVLEQTIRDLAGLWPMVASLAVVPVGLTKHRQNLFPLRGFQKGEALEVLETVTKFQQKYLKTLDSRFVFAADEWYIQGEKTFPPDEEYEDYSQLDNGVGLIRWFLMEFETSLSEMKPRLKKIRADLVIVTGQATIRLWEQVKQTLLQACPALNLEILPVENHFFGEMVTVTGLLGGQDLIRAIRAHRSSEAALYLIPQITLKQGENIFLDGVTLDELQQSCGPKRVEVVPTKADGWIQWINKKGSVAGWRVQ
jgi:putative radical SAM enzyme (TIGR03279 family)